MRDTELYRHLLGLTDPWIVGLVELDVKAQRVDVWASHPEGTRFPCPECGTLFSVRDHVERTWRHLDSCQFRTFFHVRVPRVECPTHKAKVVRVPWAEPGSQFTALFERWAIDLLQECSTQGAADLLRISWDEAWGIQERAVARGLSRRQAEVVAHVGVDEKAAAKGHDYLTIVADLDRSRVLYVAEDRKQESLEGFWTTLTPAQLEGITAMAMDMWEPYILSARAHLPDAEAKIVFDKFHVEKHVHEAVDKIRRQEHRALLQAEDERLKGTKYLWLMRPTAMTPEQRAAFRTLEHSELKAARGWALKERFRHFWGYTYPGAATRFFARWFWRATHSRLKPMAEVAHLIKRRLPNLLTYLRHRITNAGLEAVNATIEWVKKTARGFRNRQHFMTAIYFHCGGLDLYPQ